MARDKRNATDVSEVANSPSIDDAIKLEKKEAKIAAKVLVRGYIPTMEDGELKSALTLLIGTSSRAPRGSVSSINSVLHDALIAAGDDGLSEMDIFMQFKIGRPEMTIKTRIFLKTANPEDRVWVKFFAAEEIYRVLGTGSTAPEGWDGYTPADENIL